MRAHYVMGMIERTLPEMLTPAANVSPNAASDSSVESENSAAMAVFDERNVAAAPDAPSAELSEAQARPRLDPTRYGDWELNGKCVDF